MEADLHRFYPGIDYCDRWRGRLSLRKIHVLVTHLPAESACAAIWRQDRIHWSLEAHLLDDLHIALTTSKKRKGKPHPLRPKGKPKRLNRRAIEAGQRRRAARAAALERRRTGEG